MFNMMVLYKRLKQRKRNRRINLAVLTNLHIIDYTAIQKPSKYAADDLPDIGFTAFIKFFGHSGSVHTFYWCS